MNNFYLPKYCVYECLIEFILSGILHLSIRLTDAEDQ